MLQEVIRSSKFCHSFLRILEQETKVFMYTRPVLQMSQYKVKHPKQTTIFCNESRKTENQKTGKILTGYSVKSSGLKQPSYHAMTHFSFFQNSFKCMALPIIGDSSPSIRLLYCSTVIQVISFKIILLLSFSDYPLWIKNFFENLAICTYASGL